MKPDGSNLLRTWRHHLHSCPELGFEEHETAAFIAARLREFGLQVHQGIGGTGVVGVLDRGPGSSIGFRAELDALAIEEAGTAPHRSKNPRRMHACGHDGHMTMLLGAAHRLAEDEGIAGKIHFIFQPAEEHGRGADAMMRGGLERFAISRIFALHNWPTLPAGTFAVRPGAMMASEHNFVIRVIGRGGHSSAPQATADPVLPAAEIVCALQSIVSRRLGPFEKAVVSVTEITGDGTRNVIPGEIRLSGDFRTLDADIQQRVEEEMRRIVDGICAAHHVTGELSITHDFVETYNDPKAADIAVRAAVAVAGAGNVDSTCDPVMASDDFGRLSSEIPGAYVLIGNGGDRASVCGLHNAAYDFNDDILPAGEAFWVALARILCGPRPDTP